MVNRFKLPPIRPSQALSQHRDAVCLAATPYRVANPRVSVDVLTPKDLPPKFRVAVVQEARHV